MTSTQDVQRYADAIMAMIKEDQDSGQIPGDVSSWDEVDDTVDAEDYYRQAHMPAGNHEAHELRDAVSAEVGRRLAGSQGGPWGVTWNRPDGTSHDVSRAVGYATQAEAEAVGQEYLASHGGTYEVHSG
jgi:hypothetical protein